jgi:lantibiotic modifying enzyme
MNETITSNLIVLTHLLDDDDLRLIKEESSKRNFFYSLHCINKLGALKVQELLHTYTFINISENTQSLAELIVNSYIKNFKESLFVTLAHEFNILVEDQVIEYNLSLFIAEITNDGEWQEYFFDKYPLVEKLLESTIDNALKFTLQFLKDLDEDYHEVNKTFKTDLRDLITLEMSISDNHNNQSGVVKMVFSSTSLYYKPRPLQPEKKIYEFFSFVQKFGLKKSVYIPVIIDRSSHGWMEGVDFQAVETEAELLEFYENQGINLALFYFLGVADLIGDNIIAKGVLPCYFDLECILQPDIDDLDLELFELNSYAAKMIRTSVLRTNLLPQYGFITHEFQGISVSGLSYVKGSYPEMKIENTNGQFKRHYESTAFSHKNLQLENLYL